MSDPFHLPGNLMFSSLVWFDGLMSMTKHGQAIQNDHNTRFSGKGNAGEEYKVGIEENHLKNKKRENTSLNLILYFYFIY